MGLFDFFSLKATDDLAAGERTGAGGARVESKPKPASGGGYNARAGEIIRGNLARGGDGKFTSAGNASGKKPTKPKPSQRRTAKPKAPPKAKKPPVDRAAEGAKKREANRASVTTALAATLPAGAASALLAFADGGPMDAAQQQALIDAGLLEKGTDGSVRLSVQGRTFAAAADSGDSRRALDAVSAGRDRLAKAGERQAATEERKRASDARKAEIAARRAAAEAKRNAPKPAKGGGGGSGSKPKKDKVPPPQAGDPLTSQHRDLAARLSEGDALEEWEIGALVRNGLATYDKKDNLILTARGIRALQPPKQKSFAVFKDHTGRHRWLAVSSTAFQDRDQEIVSTEALVNDVARTDALDTAGPLRFWHIPGLDLGDCDYAAVSGRTLLESGTFRDERYGQALKDSPQEWQISLGFLHPADQPDSAGVFHKIQRFERSIVPAGRASNPFTRLTVKEVQMSVPLTAEKEAALQQLMGDKELLQQLLANVAQTEKDADAAGVAYKAAADALPPEVEAEAKAPGDAEEVIEIEAAEDVEDEPAGEYVGDMTPAAFSELLTTSLAAALAPLMEAVNIEAKMSGALAEMKDLVGGYAKTKDDAAAAQGIQIAALKAQIEASAAEQAKLKAALDELTGDQPRSAGYRASVSGPAPSQALKEAAPQMPAGIDPDIANFFFSGRGA